MSLVPNWRAVIKHAWSLQLIALAFFFSMAEIALPAFDGVLPIPPRAFAILSGFTTAAAYVARLLAQSKLSETTDAGE
ncbi:hypothetical protein [Aureimonas sp. AU40]|uniref:DUF7940 domain-containing protein n=1 Tax=Aureimonas sp. AU40 TaxID=1637747 RepID=UPI000781A1E0|nr:hypothetical protein [Aureimonas sp. AU40]